MDTKHIDNSSRTSLSSQKALHLPISIEELARLHKEHSDWSKSKPDHAADSTLKQLEKLRQKVVSRES